MLSAIHHRRGPVTDTDRLEISLITRALVTGKLNPAAHLAAINQTAIWWRSRTRSTKTGRVRGQLISYIRLLASSVPSFTHRDLHRWMTPLQASSNCAELVRNGELKVLHRGSSGRHHSNPTIYSLA